MRQRDLSPRQMDVLGLVVQGMGNREIARTLHISEHTVRNTLQAMFHKLAVDNRLQLALLAIRTRMVDFRVDAMGGEPEIRIAALAVVRAAGFEPATPGLEGRCSDPAELRPHAADSTSVEGRP